MHIETFYDPATFTLTYVVFDETTRDAVVIDPVLDYDPHASSVSTRSVESVAAFIARERLQLHFVLETHAHADHLSGSQFLKQRYGARVAIGARIREVQRTFASVLDLGPDFAPDGRQFDLLLEDGQQLRAGALTIEAIATPGHTPACMTFAIGDAVFTGDALFVEDSGTGRCDFPRGSADELYTSVHDRLYALPDATRVFVGHDYQPDGRALRFATTIGASKEKNVQLRASTPRAAFVQARQERDATLARPRLLYPSVQVNVNAGRLPAGGAQALGLFERAQRRHEGYRDVEPKLVHTRLGAVRIVDVREPTEFAGELGHPPGAELVPLGAIERAASTWLKDEEIVLVCRSGARSARAAMALAAMGFSRVMNMVGGMIAWNAQSLAVAR